MTDNVTLECSVEPFTQGSGLNAEEEAEAGRQRVGDSTETAFPRHNRTDRKIHTDAGSTGPAGAVRWGLSSEGRK